ncbi:hypothetical protein EUA93_19350 [Nocardioides oleivorans]|uniref:S9 family peptidase n=1 Tax=Nocardioides oleivorans TaxID=273676 RepID=A0A4Q2RTC5_9ACTN|nr:hypothetical protein [Nocardioides oleivorans]RYB91085.1 hypothetical protein EUA93_19350 [Nocardioides oleivorans]
MMTSRALRVAAAVLVYAGVGLSLAERSDASPEGVASRSVTAPRADRLVWAASGTGLRNLHVRSSRTDGTRVRQVYDNARGFTMRLVPSPNGRRVAFVTCCRDDLPLLVVAPTSGGPHLAPLEDHPELEAADGIGWSFDGRSLAFTAIVQEGEQRIASLWTIRLDGSDLQHVLTLGDVLGEDAPSLLDTVVWTDEGILFSNVGKLMLAHDGTSSPVMGGVWSVSSSADGRRLVLLRGTRWRHEVWLSRADGSGATKVAQWRLREPTTYVEVAANHDGSRLLALRSDGYSYSPESAWVAWDVRKGLRSAEVLPVPDDTSVLAWH